MKATLFFVFFPLLSLWGQMNVSPVKRESFSNKQSVYLTYNSTDSTFSFADTSAFQSRFLTADGGSFRVVSGKIVFMDFRVGAGDRMKRMKNCSVYVAEGTGSYSELHPVFLGHGRRNGKFRIVDGSTNNRYFFIAEGYPPLEISFRHGKK